MQGISRLAEDPLVCQEERCFMQLVQFIKRSSEDKGRSYLGKNEFHQNMEVRVFKYANIHKFKLSSFLSSWFSFCENK